MREKLELLQNAKCTRADLPHLQCLFSFMKVLPHFFFCHSEGGRQAELKNLAIARSFARAFADANAPVLIALRVFSCEHFPGRT